MFSDDQPIDEVTVTQLSRSAPELVRRAAEGERLIITKHGIPVAVTVGLVDAFEALVAGSERFSQLRREALEELESDLTSELPRWPAS